MNAWIRQFHRWVAVVFLLAFITNIVVNFIVVTPKEVTLGVGLFTLLPLGLLMLTGLYMLVLPYVTKRAGAE